MNQLSLVLRTVGAVALFSAVTSGPSHAVSCGAGCWQAPGSGEIMRITWNTTTYSTAQIGTYAYGDGTYVSGSSFALPSGYSLIDTYTPTGANSASHYAINFSPNLDANPATWSITTSGTPPHTYSSFILVFAEPSSHDYSPDWIAFNITNLLAGGYRNLGHGEDLSKVYLYGGPSLFTAAALPAVPLPAAMPLFASGLSVIGFLGWRRRRKGKAVPATA